LTRYSYKAVDRSGKSVSGQVDAETEAQASAKLRFLGMQVRQLSAGGSGSKASWRPIQIEPGGKISIALTPPSASFKDITIFTKQLSVLINAGVSVVQCLEMLASQQTNPYFKHVLISVQRNIQSGQEFSEALGRHPDVFDELYCSLVKAGASAGALDKMLEKLADYLERSTKLRRQLVSAVSYPAGIVVIAVVLLVVQLVFVVPMFKKQFDEAGQELPAFTQIVIGASEGMITNFPYIVGTVVLAYLAMKQWLRTPKGRFLFDQVSLKLPVMGNVLMKISLARFATTMSTLIAGGVALIETLDICARAAGNKFVEDEILQIKLAVSKGTSIADAMHRRPMMPPMMTGMVRVGESSGQLDVMFKKVSDFYEDEVDVVVSQALKMLEPMLFVVLGGIVGVVLIAMYLPIFDLASTQTGG
jgi:type IV pilus assembly protein PilC